MNFWVAFEKRASETRMKLLCILAKGSKRPEKPADTAADQNPSASAIKSTHLLEKGVKRPLPRSMG
jgi:hypothetical protein